MTNKHTQGPWRVVRSDPAQGVDCWWICAGGDSREKEFGTVYGGIDPHHEANARLISAAPDLLNALKLFEKQWSACGPNSDFGRHFRNVRDAAIAALAKAEGR